jgi:hypothetical protein
MDGKPGSKTKLKSGNYLNGAGVNATDCYPKGPLFDSRVMHVKEGKHVYIVILFSTKMTEIRLKTIEYAQFEFDHRF